MTILTTVMKTWKIWEVCSHVAELNFEFEMIVNYDIHVIPNNMCKEPVNMI